ncbi:MAG: ATP-binding cassette domain-containing protein, partial [Candidatus Omnitrophota bacterium]
MGILKMIAINNVSKNYGGKALFRNISFVIGRGEKIGLIGPNGVGKSTLFSMILGDLEPSTGNIRLSKGIRMGYLPQEASFLSRHTVLSELMYGDEFIARLIREKKVLEEKNEAASRRYGEILYELDARGYFELEHKSKKVLAGLGFKQVDFARPITQMSGGWQMRVLLAKLLVFHYDILLLDEPTNYLDLNAALWFKNYLAGFKRGFVMISHDRAFLDEVTNYTLVIENGSVFKVKRNYEHYKRIRDDKYVSLLKKFKEQEKRRKQLEKFIARFHGQPN